MANPPLAPGVHMEKFNRSLRTITAVPGSVSAFIGYTQKAGKGDRALSGVPVAVGSMADYERHFGVGPDSLLTLDPFPLGAGKEPGARQADLSFMLRQFTPTFYLYRSLALYFHNGGGSCYIVSVGGYEDVPRSAVLRQGLTALESVTEPSLVVVPDSVSVGTLAECADVHKGVLEHCAGAGNRFAILDVYAGYQSLAQGNDCVEEYRGALGINHMENGAAYYPWLSAIMPELSEVTHRHLDLRSRQILRAVMSAELSASQAPAEADLHSAMLEQLAAKSSMEAVSVDAVMSDLELHQRLLGESRVYQRLHERMRTVLSLVPASGAVAGVYVSVDKSRGIWKAPANISINGVVAPAVSMDDAEQESLNISPQGKSINAIRAFSGRGILVWGARTLDGNSGEWRYVSVRRTVLMIEQSIRLACSDFVFEPNDANTWVALKSMVGQFLTDIWRQGGLAGESVDKAFAVRAGLGETMTQADIAQGIIRIEVAMAPIRPAEFIVIRIDLQLHVS